MGRRLHAFSLVMCLLFTVVCGRMLYVARSGDFAVGQSYNSYTLLFEQNDTEITDRQGRSMGGTRKEWVAVIRPTQDCLRELPRLFAPGDVQRIAKELQKGYPVLEPVATKADTNHIVIMERTVRDSTTLHARQLLDSASGSLAKNQWHSYVFSISKSCFTVFVDGKLVSSSTTGENFGTVLDSDWFKAVFQNAGANPSKLTFGVNPYWSTTVGGTYYLLDGYISDFCIYDQALSLGDVESAKADQLKATQTNYDANTTQVIYKDPCTATGYTTAKDNVYGTYLPLNKSGVATQVEPVKDRTDTAAGYTYTMLYNPGDTIDNGAVFRMGGDSDNYFRVNEDGTIEYKSGDSSFKSDSTFTLPTDKWSHVTLQVVPYISYDRIYVYIDGKQVYMYDAYKARESQCKTYADNGLTLQSLIHGTAGGTGGQVVYGEGATGKLTDVNIYRGSINAYDLFIKDTSAYAEALIRENMDLFTSTIKTFSATNILTNMAPAYELYDKASRYLDAVKLGKTVPDMDYVAKLNADLYAAIQKMTPYKAEFSTVGAQVATGNGVGDTYETVNAKYSQNLLYAGPTSSGNGSGNYWTVKKSSITFKSEVYYNSAVFLYDGTQNDNTNIMCMPVVFSQFHSGLALNDFGMVGVYAANGTFTNSTADSPSTIFRLISDYHMTDGKPDVANADGTLKADPRWTGYSSDGKWAYNNYMPNGSDAFVAGDRANAYGGGHSIGGSWGDGETNLWYNVLQIQPEAIMKQTGKDSPEGKYTVPWGMYGDSGRQSSTKKKSYSSAADKQLVNNDTLIYIVDVHSASPTTLMDNATEKLKNVDKFQGANMYQLIQSITRFSADTAMEILSGMDAATSWNPATDLNATDGGAFYEQFVAKRNDLVQDFDTAVGNAINDAKGMDEQGYTKLDADMDASSDIGKIYQDAYDDLTDGDSSTGVYTDSSAAAFIKAFDAAKQHYTDLSPVATANRTDKNNPYADNQAKTASKLHDDLVLAYAKLMKRADYSQLNQLYDGSDRVQISNNGLTKNVVNENNETVRQQNYTLSTWLTFDDAATAAMKLSDNKDANANATYTKSEKTNQPMFKTGQVPVETLLQGTVNVQGTTTELSEYQTDINTKKDALDAAIKGIEVPADYTAYDAFVVVLGTQDKNAFTDEYLVQDGYTDGQVKNVFKAQAYQGSQSAAGAYNTDGTNNDRAYVEYNGSCYRNIGQSAADTEQPGQKVLDSTTSALVTALNNANNSDTLRRQFSVTFQYVVDNGNPNTVFMDKSYFYGSVGTFTVPESVTGSVYKWSVTAGGKEKDVLNYGTTYTLRMQNENAAADSILVTAYLTTDTAPAENQVQLSVQDQYRSNVYQGKLLQDTNVTVSQLEQVQVGDSAVALTGSAYYKLAGWQVMEGDKPHNINYGTYTLAELAKIAGGKQVILRPVYVYNGQDIFTVSLDGEQLDAKGYDVRVSVPKAADAYALAVKTGSTYAIATYGNAYDFYIDGSNKEFFTVNYLPAETDERGDVIRAAGYYVTDGGQLVRLDTDANIRYSLEHKFPTAFSVGMKSKSAATTFSTYSAATTGLPADVKITEMGTLYTRDAAMATDAAFTVDSVQAGKSVKMVKAKSPIDFSNQFILNYKNANAAATATYTRAYVKFTYTYETKLINGGIKTTTVQCIAYGNICDNSAFFGA